MFLNYGLVHTSANAQNFILGFYGHARFTGSLRQFVARDVGDTSWHDAYIKKYFRITAFGKKVYSAYQQEKGSVIRHILHETSSGDYPPPHMVRLAAYSVLTHDFGKNLNEKSQWNNAHIYSLATGILDGFRDYIEEAFGFKSLYPQNPTLLDDDYIKRIGYYAKYPASKAYLSEYKKTVDELLKESAATLFNKAAAVRVRGIAAVKNAQQAKFADHGSSGISGLINAEEALLCAGIEVHLGIVPSELAKVEIRNKLDNLIKGNWPNIVNW